MNDPNKSISRREVIKRTGTSFGLFGLAGVLASNTHATAGQLKAIVVPDFNGSYQLETPTVLNLLGGATDPNPGATLDYTKITIVTAPTKGRLDVDPNTGMFIYTPNYLLLHQSQPYPNLVPEFFQFTIGDSVGAVSNIATATFFGYVD